MNESPELALRYEHAFDLTLYFDKRWNVGPVSGGARFGYTSVGAGGTISGPLLNGSVVDFSGADWPTVRADGVVELNAHYMLLTDDGTEIYIRNLGYVHGPLRSADQDSAAAADIPAYFRCTPYFKVPVGRHDWLNRTVIVGVGQRRPHKSADDPPDHSVFRYYAIR